MSRLDDSVRFPIDDNTWIEFDDDAGKVRALRHLQKPFESLPDETDKAFVEAYFKDVGTSEHGYGLPAGIVRFVDADDEPAEPGLWFRWFPHPFGRRVLQEADGEKIEVIFAAKQIYWTGKKPREFVLPNAGVRAVLRIENDTRYLLTSSSATAMSAAQLPAETTTDEIEVSFQLPFLDIEIDGDFSTEKLLVVDSKGGNPKVQVQLEARVQKKEAKHPLAGYRFTFDRHADEGLRLQVKALVANCAASTRGRVFLQDPASKYPLGSGRPEPRADSAARLLDSYADPVALLGLNPPPSGGKQALDGEFVRLTGAAPQPPNPLELTPPSLPSGQPFAFSARTSNYAAVSAYHHCDNAFRLAQAFGCDTPDYFATDQFPVSVSHRGPMVLPHPPTDAIPYTDPQVYTVNAQVLQDAGRDKTGRAPDRSNRVLEIRFGLGDYSDGKAGSMGTTTEPVGPALGAACDPRWVWHEFCHALLVAATGSLELSFAHSAGDALAAILSDPNSTLVENRLLRGLTFPWVWQPLRRHDREAKAGWAWYGTVNNNGNYPGPLDPDGYVAEEILSSTLFRLYCAIGGDAKNRGGANVPVRQRAAEYVAYLIMRAIGTLGPAKNTPSTPGIFATALMEVDALRPLAPSAGAVSRPGGTLRKVIRWAFEQQGLYAPAARPWNEAGLPEPVDVFIEDGRSGGYIWIDDGQAAPSAVWIRPRPNPVPGRNNDVYLVVGNRGSRTATRPMQVRVYARSGNAADVGTWERGKWTQIGYTRSRTPRPGQTKQFGPYPWVPDPRARRHALLVVVDAVGDASLLDAASFLPLAQGPVSISEVVPFDNNLGYRMWR